MANSYFECKQFTVHQDQCAMKVSTDACLQGALAANSWQELNPKTILDVGTGTGLLSLMLAQKLRNAHLKAIEIEENAARQAAQNFEVSPWSERCSVEKIALQDFSSIQKFDAIICNPPFFHKHLNSDAQNRNLARHDEGLSKALLAQSVANFLHPNGSFCVLYPKSEWASWEQTAAQYELYAQHIFEVKPHPNKATNRVIGFYGLQKMGEIPIQEICIYKDAGKTYTADFHTLLKDYYLFL